MVTVGRPDVCLEVILNTHASNLLWKSCLSSLRLKLRKRIIMRGFTSWAAVAATVNVVSGHAVPLHSIRASALASKALHASHGLPSAVDEPPSAEDFPFDWDLASSLAGLTGAPPTATLHEYATGLPQSFTKGSPDLGSWTTPSWDWSSELEPTRTPASHSSAMDTRPTPNPSGSSTENSQDSMGDSGKSPLPSSSEILNESHSPATKTCAKPASRSDGPYWLDQQDHNQHGAGFAPYAKTGEYPVYRNAMDYSVVNDGTGDQTTRLQQAIDDDGAGGSRKGQGVARYPAQVYLPGGVYQLGSTLDLTVGTIILGDPLNPPVIKAAKGFNGDYLVMGFDSHAGQPETSFAIVMKNIILDTTALDPSRKIGALQWGVAQGSGLTNLKISMPTDSVGHVGIDIKAGSTIAVTDVDITGGAIGIRNSNQQVNFKNVSFKSCGTGFTAAGGWTVLLQHATFEGCGTGIDMTSNALGSMVLLDSIAVNTGPVVRFHDSSKDQGSQNSQFLIQNLKHDTANAIAVDTDGKVVLAATPHVNTWVWGTVVPERYETGASWDTKRPEPLLVDDKYFIKAQPTYQDFTKEDVVNVKLVSAHKVNGDGQTDDTDSLNAILAANADSCKVTYIPHGVYRVSDTIFVPVGTRIVGEAWSVISGYGSKFKNSNQPRPVVQLGKPGDVGLIEIQDMRFSVGEILPGAKIIEINAAGSQPGDVGMWNTMALVGGTADTSIATTCTSQDPKNCMAAFMVMHLTESSSAYIENFWGWTADHNLDSQSMLTIISTGRGILVEATKGTWLTGTGSEHHWLYNYNFHNAQNVFAGLLQTESPYMQGKGEYQAAPAPWTALAQYGDPDFSWCGADDQKCRSALATNIDGGSNLALYNSAAWAFFDGSWNGLYNEPCEGECQSNMMRVTNDPVNLVWYSISTRKTDVMVLDGKTNPREANHQGGWEGIIQVYGEFTA
ncbi:unnamed protein product [Penicillium salamii]|nr:unnamed protein product [Penicillium salamii]